jgi:hypothetical protein
MKTNITFFATVCLLLSCAARDADAGILQGLGNWEGSGTAFDVSGKDLGAFSVSLTRRSIGPSKVRGDGKITLAGGQQITFWQEFEDRGPSGFTIVSNNGTGHGQCFANGMCQSIDQNPDGHAFATSIANDGADRVRILVIEMEQGKTVRFYQETLLRKP